MSRPDKPVKVVLTAAISLVASSALQGTATTAQANPGQQWKAVQQSIERDSASSIGERKSGSMRFTRSKDPIEGGGPGSPVPKPGKKSKKS
jgi:hypothetical protein